MFRQQAHVPFYARSFAQVMRFHVDEQVGYARLLDAQWAWHDRFGDCLVNQHRTALGWFGHGSWRLAFRIRNRTFQPLESQRAATALFEQAPDESFVLPTTIVVPLCAPRMLPKTEGPDFHCCRVCPPPDKAPNVQQILGRDVEFRICYAKTRSKVQYYAEANLGPPRYNVAGQPRRAVYLADHRQWLPDDVRDKTLVRQMLVQLPRYVVEQGYRMSSAAQRPDLIPFGYYDVLPGSEGTCGTVNWPGQAKPDLFAFAALPQTGPQPSSAPVSEGDVVDSNFLDGDAIKWNSAQGAVLRRSRVVRAKL